MPRSFLVKKTDKQKDRHDKYSTRKDTTTLPTRESSTIEDRGHIVEDIHVTITEAPVVTIKETGQITRPAVIVETRQRIEDEYKRIEQQEHPEIDYKRIDHSENDDQRHSDQLHSDQLHSDQLHSDQLHSDQLHSDQLHSPATDEGYSESPLHRQSPTLHGVTRRSVSPGSPTYSPHMTPPPREAYGEAGNSPTRVYNIEPLPENVYRPTYHYQRESHHTHTSVPHPIPSSPIHPSHDRNMDRNVHPTYSRSDSSYRSRSPSPVRKLDYGNHSPRHMDSYYDRFSRHDGYQADYGSRDEHLRPRGEVFVARQDSPTRSRSPLDLTVRSSVEPVASAIAPYTPSIPNLSARLSNGYLRDALATSFYRALKPEMVPSDGSSHGYTSPYTSSPSSTSGGRLTPQGLPGYVTSPSRASVSSMSPTSPQKAQMSPLCTSLAPSPTPSPALSIQSDSDESLYSSSGRKIDRKSQAGTTFQDGVTVGYTYDAFFVSDGRSRRKNALGIPEKTRARYTCNECGKHYATSSNLSRHKQTHRSVDSKLAKKCPHCNKVYVSMPALSMHILTHELKHTCMVCNKSFSRPWLLQGHMRSHTGDKPYGCAHCGKAFADRSNLRAHMQTHSAFKHYECKRCNKSFALKSYLNKHYESACFKES